MPKIKPYTYPADCVPKANYLKELINRYAKAQHMTLADIGERMQCTGQNVGKKLDRPSDAWTIGELKAISKAVNVPFDLCLESVSR